MKRNNMLKSNLTRRLYMTLMTVGLLCVLMFSLVSCGGGQIQESEEEQEEDALTEAQTEAETETGAEATGDIGKAFVFTSNDVMEGTQVTSEELFGDNEITLVNFWASWCGPCVREMPELEKLYAELQEKGCGIVGVQCDGTNDQAIANGQEIIQATGVSYPNVLLWDDFNSLFQIQGFPTSFFVDSQGVVIGEPILGAYPDKYREQIDELL